MYIRDGKKGDTSMTQKKFKVIAIGNAIVDVLSHVNDDFINAMDVQKGMMRLISEGEANKLCTEINIENTVSGGSAANTIAGLGMFGNKVAFIGKVNSDEFGDSFERDMSKCGVHCDVNRADQKYTTAKSIILVTPDANRTMNTYLGISGHLSPNDVDEALIRDSEIIYCEGYLWDREEAKEAMRKAFNIAKEEGSVVSYSLSDSFCVDRHRNDFLDLIKNHANIVFANESEIMSLFEADFFEDAVKKCQDAGIIFAITRGELGSVVIHKDKIYEVGVEPIDKLVDTTGAGDLYAAGFLHGYINGKSLDECGRFGAIAAAEIITHFGARPKRALPDLIDSSS